MLSTQATREGSRPNRPQRRRGHRFDRSYTAVAELELPPAVFKTCPWQPRELIETGLRQWLRCCAAALRDDQVIGMPSRAVDEAWHGLILCTMRYQAFCAEAYGKFMHHTPAGGAPADDRGDDRSHGRAAAEDRHCVGAGRVAGRAVCPVGSRQPCRCGSAMGHRSGPGRGDPGRRDQTPSAVTDAYALSLCATTTAAPVAESVDCARNGPHMAVSSSLPVTALT